MYTICWPIVLICFLQYTVNAKHGKHDKKSKEEDDESYVRHIIEDGVKPAIFGSNSYDPIRQVFEPFVKDAKPGEEEKPKLGADGTVPITALPDTEESKKDAHQEEHTLAPEEKEEDRKRMARASMEPELVTSLNTPAKERMKLTKNEFAKPNQIKM